VRSEFPTTDAIAITVPTVSVVVPTFRRTERLSQLLARLASIERSGELEVIIVDQTPDANLQDLNRYSERFFSLLLIHQNEANVSRARNAGALVAGADVLLFMDDDMELMPQFISRLFDQLTKGGHVALGANWGQSAVDGLFLATGVLALRRKIFFRAHGFDEVLFSNFEDAEFSHRLKKLGISLIVDRGLRAIHHDQQRGGTWHEIPLRNASLSYLCQTAYFWRRVDCSWWQLGWKLTRSICSETIRPAYLKQGGKLERLLALIAALPSAIRFSWQEPRLLKDG